MLFFWKSLWPLFLVHVWSLFSKVISDVWRRSACGNLEQFYGGYLLRVMTCASDWCLLLGTTVSAYEYVALAASNTVSTLADELLYAAPAHSVWMVSVRNIYLLHESCGYLYIHLYWTSFGFQATFVETPAPVAEHIVPAMISACLTLWIDHCWFAGQQR